MAVMGERLPEAWMVEWHHHNRVRFPLRRWSFLQLPVLLVAGPSIATLARLPDMLADGNWRYPAYLAITVYAGLALVMLHRLVTRRRYLVVDRTGIRSGRRFLPWNEIGSIGLITGPTPLDHLPIHPKHVRSKNLNLTRQHVNDLQSFRTWLDELPSERRRSDSPRQQEWQ